jgi:hypothetical protein
MTCVVNIVNLSKKNCLPRLIAQPFTGGKLRSIEGGILSGLVDADCLNGLDLSRAPSSFEFTRLTVDSVWRSVIQHSSVYNRSGTNGTFILRRNADGSV